MPHPSNGHAEVIALGPSDGPGECRQKLSQTLAAGSSRVVIDLTEVASIDASMVSALVSALRMCSVRAGRLVLVHRTGFRLLRTSGLSQLFDIAPTRERALAKVADRRSQPPRAGTGAGLLASG